MIIARVMVAEEILFIRLSLSLIRVISCANYYKTLLAPLSLNHNGMMCQLRDFVGQPNR